MFSQTAFEIDTYGYVSDTRFHELIQEKGYELVGRFSEVKKRSNIYYARVLRNDLWGFIDVYGNEVISPKYVSVDTFKNGYTAVSYMEYIKPNQPSKCYNPIIAKRYQLIDIHANVIAKYEHVNPFYFDTTVAMKGKKAGIIDRKGNVILPFEYDEIKQYNVFTIVSKDKKWSLLNSKGKPSSGYVYDRISNFNGFFLGHIKREFVLLDTKTGKQMTPFMTSVGNLNDYNRYSYEVGFKAKTLVVKTENGFVIFNKKGKRITSKKYTTVSQLTDDFLSIRDGDCWGIMNSKGKIIIPAQYDFPLGNLGEGIFWGKLNDENIYLEAKSGKEVFSQYKNVGNFINGLAPLIFNDTGRHGYINKKGKLILPIVYDNVRYIQDIGDFPLRKNSKWGVTNSRRNIIIPFKYQEIRKSYLNYTARLDSKWGLLDKKGAIRIPFLYESISHHYTADNDWYNVSLDRKWGVVNTANEVIIPIKYDRVENRFYNGLLEVKLNGLYGFVAITGNEIIPPIYHHVDHFSYFFMDSGFVKAFTTDNKELIIDKYDNKVETQSMDSRFDDKRL